MISKWLFTALAAVMFVTTVELGHFSALHRPMAPVHRALLEPELGLPIVAETGAEPASSTSLTR